MSKLSVSGIVRYGGTKPAAVLANINATPIAIMRSCGFANRHRRNKLAVESDRTTGVQARHSGSSGVSTAPQLGQTDSPMPSTPSCGCAIVLDVDLTGTAKLVEPSDKAMGMRRLDSRVSPRGQPAGGAQQVEGSDAVLLASFQLGDVGDRPASPTANFVVIAVASAIVIAVAGKGWDQQSSVGKHHQTGAVVQAVVEVGFEPGNHDFARFEVGGDCRSPSVGKRFCRKALAQRS